MSSRIREREQRARSRPREESVMSVDRSLTLWGRSGGYEGQERWEGGLTGVEAR